MKPEDKVCTLEQAKKLKELGFKADSEKGWFNNPTEDICTISMFEEEEAKIYDWYFKYLAYNVQELEEALPAEHNCHIYKVPKSDKWFLDIIREDELPSLGTYHPTEAQARAAALIWLIENKYLEI